MGMYGYIETTTAQPQYASSNCTALPPGSRSLPNCLPSVTLSETGSALMFPMFQLWASHFREKYPNIQINTANTGSGEGQSFVSKGLVQIGGSAAYFSDQQILANPNLQNFLNIPLAVTATLVEYNVPNIPASMHLNFTATLLAEIYNTTIQYWNDPAIIAINPGAAQILRAESPPVGIWPFYRSDAAADTLLFTQYLMTDPGWNASGIGSGLTVHWPSCYTTETHLCLNNIPQAALGNPGIVIQAAPIVGSISYVSVEALDQWILPLGLHAGRLQNRAGNFVNATDGHSVEDALDVLSGNTPPDERISLENAPGPDSYPIVGYGYALVNIQQLNPEFANVIRTFLTYCVLPQYGSSLSYLNIYHFSRLPGHVLQLSLDQIAMIGP
jgi:phosphate transport system substrate-binding protein